jgi:hypothetical protein
MPNKVPPQRKPKLTDAERHERFLAMAHKVGASEDAKDLDKALRVITSIRSPKVKAK